MNLSILVCSTHTRRNTFLPSSLNSLYSQWENLPLAIRDQVEIIFLVDNKKMMLGHKRNVMVQMAQGEYVVFIDDDDIITDDYISSIIKSMVFNTDVISFLVSVTLNGSDPKICKYSILFDEDHNTETQYHRLPNHICAIRRNLALQVKYPSIPYGEDSGFSKAIHPLLKSEYIIEKVLYHYVYNQDTTETQMHLKTKKKIKWRR